MKGLIIGFFLLFQSQVDLNIIRSEFNKILSFEEASKAFINRFDAQSDPLVDAYVAGARCIAAGTYLNPYSKYREFQNGQQSLDKVILKNSNNPEMRYIRLLIQLEAPSFLGYSSKISEDLNIFSSRVASYSQCTESYRKTMLNNLKGMVKSSEHRLLLQSI